VRKKRKRRTVIVPVVSMGDIAFLLIIFFMVCSNFAKEAGLRLKPPQAIEVDQIKETKISVTIDSEGQIYLQGQLMSSADEVETGLTALLERRTTDAERVVMFKCDRETDKAVFEPVLDAIANAGGILGAIGEKQQRP
jgi:biopolymer transport protein ExbD